MDKVPVLTIDGPSGSGKGTVSRAAARALGWALLDSGALYRLVALAGRQAGVPLGNGPELARMGEQLDLRVGCGLSGEELVWLRGAGVTRALGIEAAVSDATKRAAIPQITDA